MAKPDLVSVVSNPAGSFFRDAGDHQESAGGGGGGASTFLDLTDTPADYFDGSGSFIKINRDFDGLEFTELTTGDLANWAPLGNQILYQDQDDGVVKARPDRSLAIQLEKTYSLNSSTPTVIDAADGFAVKLLASDGTASPNLLTLGQIGGKPGTRCILWYETETAVGDTITVTSDAQLAIIELNGTTGARTVNNIDSITMTGVSSWIMLESRILEWHLIDYSGCTVNMA